MRQLRYRVESGGWISAYDDGEVEYFVGMKLDDDGRLVPWAAVVRPRYGIQGRNLLPADLREVPLNEIEAAANGPQFRPSMLERYDEETNLGGWIQQKTVMKDDERSGRRQRPTGKVRVPDGGRYPDAFYRRVAAEYTRLVASGERAAAKVIAEANDVPTTTAHRWVKEARRREFLVPGRAGRAG